MAIKVLVPTMLQKETNNQAVVECSGSSVNELLDTLEKTFPGIKGNIDIGKYFK